MARDLLDEPVRESVVIAPDQFQPVMIDRDVALAGEIPREALDGFQRMGFAVIERMIEPDLVERLKGRFEPLFRGEFDTGIYPDEWYWREGMSLPDVTRHMGNSWKSDRTIGSVVLSPAIGRLAATLAGWDGVRIGTDTLWWKPPGTKEIALHQDDTYGSFFLPPNSITCWIALDDTTADGGTIEYVVGSNSWPLKPDIGDFHAPGDYRSAMRRAAAAAGEMAPQIARLVVPAGTCVIHSGRVWHGSDRNRTSERVRRSIGVHLLRHDTRFAEEGVGYIYGRYKRDGDTTLDESFFPILWTEDGYRTPSIDRRYEDALS